MDSVKNLLFSQLFCHTLSSWKHEWVHANNILKEHNTVWINLWCVRQVWPKCQVMLKKIAPISCCGGSQNCVYLNQMDPNEKERGEMQHCCVKMGITVHIFTQSHRRRCTQLFTQK